MTCDRITHDPHVMGGNSCIRGIRITAGMVLGMLSAGHRRERILAAYPDLEEADIGAVLAYAS